MEKGKIIKGITKNGFRFEVKEDVLKDWSLMELLSEVEEKPTVIVKLFLKLLGKKQYDNLKNHIKKMHDGHVTTEDMMLAFNDIMSASPETKK